MYTSYFGLNEKPFAITPDPRYLFMSERHGEGLAHLLYGVTDSGGFIQLTGEVGTGKTTLVRTLLGQLPDEVEVALILNPQVTVLEFLQSICKELGVALPEDRNSPMALVDALNRYLLDAHAEGRRIILLIDEAQNLSEEVLEQLRLLTNLETARQKLLQIILIGQPELREILAQNNLRQLAQRVTGRYHLEPLSREEAARYIDHRMKVAGAVGETFSSDAKREIHRLSGGIPRIINIICDRALLGAYGREVRQVDRKLVRRAAAEISGIDDTASVRTRRNGTAWRWAAGIAALAAAAALGFGLRPVPLPAVTDSVADVAEPAPAEDVALLAVNDSDSGAADSTAPDAAATVAENGAAEAPEDAEDLDAILVSGRVSATREAAMARLLKLWGVDRDPGAGEGCDQADAAGLSCLWRRGSWSMLAQLDRPAILTLTDSRGGKHAALLTGLNGDQARVVVGDRSLSMSIAEVSDFWFSQFMMLWRPAGGADAITPGSRGPSVVWLRRSLAELNGAESPDEDDDFFDADLESEVREFQREHRLMVDGLAGTQTQIVINSALGKTPVPRLSGDS